MTTPSRSSFCKNQRHHAAGRGLGGRLGTTHEPAADTLWNDLIAFKTSESSTHRTDAGGSGSNESIITHVEASSMRTSRFISAVESRVDTVGGESLWVEYAFPRAPSHSEAIVITQAWFLFETAMSAPWKWGHAFVCGRYIRAWVRTRHVTPSAFASVHHDSADTFLFLFHHYEARFTSILQA